MNIWLLDTAFNQNKLIEDYISILWVDRYSENGDFELIVPATKENLKTYKPDWYLKCSESDSLMIIEYRQIQTDAEDGNKLTIKGYSIGSILSRRIVWGQLNVQEKIQDAVKIILTNCFISPSDTNRKLDNFVYAESTNDIFKYTNKATVATYSALQSYSKSGLTKYDILEVTADETRNGVTAYYYCENNTWIFTGIKSPAVMVDAQYYGEQVSDIITNLLSDTSFGYKLQLIKYELFTTVNCFDRGTDTTKTDIMHFDKSKLANKGDVIKVTTDETRSNQTTYYRWDDTQWLYLGIYIPTSQTSKLFFEFSLYCGIDRTFDQVETLPIVYSHDYDNLVTSDLNNNKEDFKNVTLIAGEGEGTDRKTQTISLGNQTITGINRREIFTDANSISQTVDESTLTDEQYYQKLQTEGTKNIKNYRTKYDFDAEIIENSMYKYKKDYFLGDLIVMKDIFGNVYNTRISEYTYSIDTDGFKKYPTLNYEKTKNIWEDIYSYTWQFIKGLIWENVRSDTSL